MSPGMQEIMGFRLKTWNKLIIGSGYLIFIICIFRDLEGNFFMDPVFNETVQIVEFDEGFDSEVFFMYVFLVAGLVLCLFLVYSFLRGSKGKKSTPVSKPVETGTTNDDVDYEWIPRSGMSSKNSRAFVLKVVYYVQYSPKTFVRSAMYGVKLVTPLITGSVGGTSVDPHFCKMRTFFLMSLTLTEPSLNNFQLRVGGDKGLPLWNRPFSRNFSLYPSVIYLYMYFNLP